MPPDVLVALVRVLLLVPALSIVSGFVAIARAQRHALSPEQEWPGYLRGPEAFTPHGRRHRTRALRLIVTGWILLLFLGFAEWTLRWAGRMGEVPADAAGALCSLLGSVLLGTGGVLLLLFAGRHLKPEARGRGVGRLLRSDSYTAEGGRLYRLARGSMVAGAVLWIVALAVL